MATEEPFPTEPTFADSVDGPDRTRSGPAPVVTFPVTVPEDPLDPDDLPVPPVLPADGEDADPVDVPPEPHDWTAPPLMYPCDTYPPVVS
jgi:hypothetical protein